MGNVEKALFYKYLLAPTTRTYYEFGSGGSTYKAINAPNIDKIVSMESDTTYYINTLSQLTSPKCERIFVDVGSFNNWGNPALGLPKSRYELYFKHISSISWVPDLVLIDGRWRVACALHTWRKIVGTETVVLVDDFQRPEYASILKYFNIIERAGNMVALKARVDIKMIGSEDFDKYESDHR